MDNNGIVALPLAVAGGVAIYFSKAVWLSWLAAAFAVSLIVVGILGVIGVKNGIEDLGGIGDVLSIFDLEPRVGSGLMVLIAGGALALVACVAHARSFAAVRPADEA
jgi:hypothetical protein